MCYILVGPKSKATAELPINRIKLYESLPMRLDSFVNVKGSNMYYDIITRY